MFDTEAHYGLGYPAGRAWYVEAAAARPLGFQVGAQVAEHAQPVAHVLDTAAHVEAAAVPLGMAVAQNAELLMAGGEG